MVEPYNFSNFKKHYHLNLGICKALITLGISVTASQVTVYKSIARTKLIYLRYIYSLT